MRVSSQLGQWAMWPLIEETVRAAGVDPTGMESQLEAMFAEGGLEAIEAWAAQQARTAPAPAPLYNPPAAPTSTPAYAVPSPATAPAVDPQVCLAIQCGAMTQDQAGFDTLLACANAGYTGVRARTDPACAPFFPTAPAVTTTTTVPTPAPTTAPVFVATAEPAPASAPTTAPPASTTPAQTPAAEPQPSTGDQQAGSSDQVLIGSPWLPEIKGAKAVAQEAWNKVSEVTGAWPWWAWLLIAAAAAALLRRRR